MTQCPDISMLRFSHSGQTAIEEINRVQKSGNMLTRVLGSSVLLKIFTGHRIQLQGSAHNIVQKDWELWAQALRAVPIFLNRRIRDVARKVLLKPLTTDEKQFWEAVADGCH
ncbi:MAG: hypothetical protein L3J88_03455 [Gammaproteobacteria bacterium]|nr:hypothetical protein [Gammaproteobacteria bacterium]MCF6362406.1 hypothetical protein [Gammaproteobacteria bacterium]